MGLSLRLFTSVPLFFWLSLFLHLTVSDSTSPVQPLTLCHDDERSALLQFKESLIIMHRCNPLHSPNKVASWKAEEKEGDCCSWDGVTCSEVTGHVIKLDLSSSCLYGSLNSDSSLFHLVHLEWLNLADNNFNFSKIPSKIISLSRLSHLNLSSSDFSGQIPFEILELSKLISLDVSSNFLELYEPGLRSLVEKLTNLEILDLSEVIISSLVPHKLANLSSLTYLSFAGCNLQGEFPTKIFRLPKLQFLILPSNGNLTGYLPEFLKSSPLKKLSLSLTQFSGEIPESIGNLKSLVFLDIHANFFSGIIPSSLGDLDSLRRLDLSSNYFSSPNSRSLSWISKLNRLTYLDLSDINFVGEIPSWLMNLTQLTQLKMERSLLTGPIPYWLINMNHLTTLFLNYNQLTGHIPSQIGNLTQLTALHLGSNQLEGPIPRSIFELENLQELELYSNNLSGTLDLELFLPKLKSLKRIMLSSNNLSLLTETTFNTSFPKLLTVELSSCNLRKFPNFLRTQDQLQVLDLSSNMITGQIPRWLLNDYCETKQENCISKGALNVLGVLNLSYNLLTGFEQQPCILPSIGTLDLRYNKLQGPLPLPLLPTLQGPLPLPLPLLPKLQGPLPLPPPPSLFAASTMYFLVSNNQLIGKVPPLICSLRNLLVLDLSHNNLSGMLPDCLGNFSNQLSVLKLRGNKFHGRIPNTFMNGTNLRMIDLSHNLLKGRIPRSLVNCTMLKFLDLGSNQITDNFPSWLGTLQELQVLILKSNRFYGAIKEHATEYEFPKLHIIDLSHNRFTGNLPLKSFQCWDAMKVVNASGLIYMRDILLSLSLLPNFAFFDYSITLSNKGIEINYEKLSNLVTAIILSNNEFVGEIPTSIGNLKGLHILNISNNNLQGYIPSSLSNITMLESLDLSNNRLSGEIPPALIELTYLEFFDVSNNNLSGSIPQGKQFNTFENSSYDGNPGLCGKPLTKICENSEASQEEDQDSSSLFAFGWKIVVIGYGSGVIMGLVLGHIVTTRKPEWFAKTFGLQLKTIKRMKS